MRGRAMAANPAQSTLPDVPRPSKRSKRRRPMTLTIEHLAQRHCFQAIVDGQRCVVDYDFQPSSAVLTITHTFVPPALEGRGIARQLTQAVLDYARAQQLRVRPLCSYARAYLRRHPEALDLVA